MTRSGRNAAAVCASCDGIVADVEVTIVEGETYCPDDALAAQVEHARPVGSWPVMSG